jgi:hypothetical protein
MSSSFSGEGVNIHKGTPVAFATPASVDEVNQITSMDELNSFCKKRLEEIDANHIERHIHPERCLDNPGITSEQASEYTSS